MQSTDPFGWVGSLIDGKFAIDAVAGAGGFGVVYRGVHLGFELPIAVKCLRIPPGVDERQRRDLLSKFREEARLLHRLSRRTASIVQALDIGAAAAPNGQWTPYIVMEWLEGETLASDLQRRCDVRQEPRSLTDAIRLLAPAAAALAIAHEEGVSHRDVKPANLFLVKSKSGTTLKILDFGIATVLSEAPLIQGLRTQSGEPLQPFTPQYGAPEQFSARFGVTGPWTDVFAMALVLLEVASGRPALVGTDVIQLFTAAVEEGRRPSLWGRGVSATSAMEAVFSRALAATATERFRDMGALWTALEAALGASSALTKPVSEQHDALAATVPVRPPPELDASYAPTVAAVTGENRVCTVMFIDLSEATRLSARLDAEDVKEIVDRCFSAVKEQVEATGGVVEELLGGDRAMALFGVPRATDNDAERAVIAALRLQAAIGRVSLPRPLRSTRLTARIGITTGRVFTELSGGATRQRVTVIGETVNLASRLQQTAAPGAILLGRDTYRQVVNAFDVEPLPPIEAGSRSEALPVYQVRGQITFRPVMALSDFYGVETKLVGRAAETQRLADALDTMLTERRAGLVTVTGAPGVGRSRILASFFSSMIVRRADLVVMVGQCSPLFGSTSYGLVASMIRRRFGILDADAPGVVRHKLRRGMRWLRMRAARMMGADARQSASTAMFAEGLDAADLDDALTQVAAILGAASAVSVEPGAMSLDEAGNAAKQRIFAAIARLLRFVADAAPIVILCDDIHWADGASLDLLDDLLLRAEDLPVLAVCTARPELYERLPTWGEGKAAHTRIDVAPLARRYMEEMVRDWLRRVSELSPSIVRTLADRAEGHPLTLAETLHLLMDAGVIEARGEDPWLIREEQLGAIALPATVQGIAQARLDRLDAEPRNALARAAVVGRTFWEGAVQRLRHADPQGARDTAPAGLLSTLRHRQLIRPRESAMFPGEREYVFAESAMYEVAYETLSVKVRRPLHLMVARWLEERASGNAGSALIAQHYDRGGDPGRAVTAYVRAAERAASLGENAAALSHLERARDLYDDAYGDSSAGDGGMDEQGGIDEQGAVAPWRDGVRLRLDLGDVLRRLGRLDDAERAYEEARARIARSNEGGSPDVSEALRFEARVDHRLALVHRVRGSTKEARPLVERAISRAKEAGAVEETPAMYALLAFLYRRERRPDASWQAAREGLRVCRSLERRNERWREEVVQLLFGVAASLFSRGRMVGAERSYRQASRVISEAENPYLVGIALNGVGAVRFTIGDWSGARAIYLRALRLKERAGDLHQIAVTSSNLAEVELLLKNLPAALEHARRAVRLGEQTRAGSDLADMYRNLAGISLAAEQLDEALTAGRKALSIAEITGRVYLGEVAVTLARVCARAAGDAALRARALEAAEVLVASLSAHFNEGELRKKAEECQGILAQVFRETHS